MIGTTLEKYEILEEVGQGGMATVYRARDLRLGREVALKVLHPHLARQEEARRRFRREAQAVARLRHPAILEIYDYSGEEVPTAYIATEFIRGESLRDHLERRAPELPEVGMMIAVQLLGALQHAHENGVIHRDVKPENVLIGHDGGIKLADFGIAHLADGQGMTVTGTLLGSPAHMSPEQIQRLPQQQPRLDRLRRQLRRSPQRGDRLVVPAESQPQPPDLRPALRLLRPALDDPLAGLQRRPERTLVGQLARLGEGGEQGFRCRPGSSTEPCEHRFSCLSDGGHRRPGRSVLRPGLSLRPPSAAG